MKHLEMSKLNKRWELLNNAYMTDKKMVDDMFDTLASSYGGKGRYYHNMEHIAHMLDYLTQVAHDVDAPDLICYAIWFHDAVYKAGSKSNEKQSAEMALSYLRNSALDPHALARVAYLIECTKDHTSIEAGSDVDLDYFLDIDLCILGSEPEKYVTYVKAIRKEFKFFPDFLYKPGRKRVLQKFLDSEHIYRTSYFRSLFEIAARANLINEIEML